MGRSENKAPNALSDNLFRQQQPNQQAMQAAETTGAADCVVGRLADHSAANSVTHIIKHYLLYRFVLLLVCFTACEQIF